MYYAHRDPGKPTRHMSKVSLFISVQIQNGEILSCDVQNLNIRMVDQLNDLPRIYLTGVIFRLVKGFFSPKQTLHADSISISCRTFPIKYSATIQLYSRVLH